MFSHSAALSPWHSQGSRVWRNAFSLRKQEHDDGQIEYKKHQKVALPWQHCQTREIQWTTWGRLVKDQNQSNTGPAVDLVAGHMQQKLDFAILGQARQPGCLFHGKAGGNGFVHLCSIPWLYSKPRAHLLQLLQSFEAPVAFARPTISPHHQMQEVDQTFERGTAMQAFACIRSFWLVTSQNDCNATCMLLVP